MARSSHFGVAAIDPFLIRAMVVGGNLWDVGPLGWRISFLGSYCLLKRGFASSGDGGTKSSCFAATTGLVLADGGVLMGLPWIRRCGATSLVVQSNIGADGYSPEVSNSGDGDMLWPADAMARKAGAVIDVWVFEVGTGGGSFFASIPL
ncbi:hypothetical protein M0R45_008883 [Rubus argutus]|uniref:Uncharacterized protein n=1 Tax=Rubus argutus TaxID=59490 RepID=A0AAW1Y2Y5_RUBAR